MHVNILINVHLHMLHSLNVIALSVLLLKVSRSVDQQLEYLVQSLEHWRTLSQYLPRGREFPSSAYRKVSSARKVVARKA